LYEIAADKVSGLQVRNDAPKNVAVENFSGFYSLYTTSLSNKEKGKKK
jgi:hypothetical protein